MKNETFSQILKRFEYSYDLRTVFSDFLTMTICASTRNPLNGLSHYEDLYLKTIEPYKADKLHHEFPKAFAQLILEMQERINAGNANNDILGEFYEQNLYRKGAQQYFTPWPICSFMAKSIKDHLAQPDRERPLRVLDPACGSGRMLIAAREAHGREHEYYGIDIDDICVKMTAINMFYNGMWRSEVMCANALLPDDFRYSYRISLLPFGIFHIEEKEKSPLWNLVKNSLEANLKPKVDTSKIVLGKDQDKFDTGKVSQITLF